MKPILDFKTFQRIFEADETPKEGVLAIAPLVLSLYLQLLNKEINNELLKREFFA